MPNRLKRASEDISRRNGGNPSDLSITVIL